MSTLEIKDLHVSVKTEEGLKEILHGVTLTIKNGEVHAIMGPNGSGKSTLAMAVMGHPKYEITSGSVLLDGEDISEMSVDERARAGIFLGMQHPVEVQGVSVSNFLRTAKTAIAGDAPNLRNWLTSLKTNMKNLEMDEKFASRDVNVGFSGGEKKRFEILSMEVLNPLVGILDEIDSGLDIDALRAVSEGINRIKTSGNTSVLLITHYTRILQHVIPDKVHVFVDGKIAESGGPELGERLEAEGYERYQKSSAL
jgi:Fe-S cluster assembly ATP-binding protein